jgi:hypothetical protein
MQELQIGGTRSGIKIRRAVDVNARHAGKSAPERKLRGTKKQVAIARVILVPGMTT